METPFIIIDGEKIQPAPPRMKVWRVFLKAAEKDRTNEQLEDFLDEQVDLIVTGFGKEAVVNRQSIDENLEISEVVPLVRRLFTWIQTITFQKLAEAPNAKRSRA